MKLKLTISQFFLSILFIHGRVLATCNNGDDWKIWQGVVHEHIGLSGSAGDLYAGFVGVGISQ